MNGMVHHLGCSQRNIAKRLRHYENTETETRKPAFRVRGFITEELKAGSEVAVSAAGSGDAVSAAGSEDAVSVAGAGVAVSAAASGDAVSAAGAGSASAESVVSLSWASNGAWQSSKIATPR